MLLIAILTPTQANRCEQQPTTQPQMSKQFRVPHAQANNSEAVVTTLLSWLSDVSDEKGETRLAVDGSPAKPPANGMNQNGTERNDWRRIRLKTRDSMGLTERTGMEWNRAPMFRKQHAVGSNPTAGSHKIPEFKRLSSRSASGCFLFCRWLTAHLTAKPSGVILAAAHPVSMPLPV